MGASERDMEPTMQALRLFFVQETSRSWREIDEREEQMRQSGLLEGPAKSRDYSNSWDSLARQKELGELWQRVQRDAVQFAELKRRFIEASV